MLVEKQGEGTEVERGEAEGRGEVEGREELGEGGLGEKSVLADARPCSRQVRGGVGRGG